jgi:hypothetical protein
MRRAFSRFLDVMDHIDEAARLWVELLHESGDLWPRFRSLAALVGELDARYGAGWELCGAFRDAVARCQDARGGDGGPP